MTHKRIIVQGCLVYCIIFVTDKRITVYDVSFTGYYTVKKGLRFSRPQMSLTKLSASESVVCDILAGDRKISNLFYSVVMTSKRITVQGVSYLLWPLKG